MIDEETKGGDEDCITDFYGHTRQLMELRATAVREGRCMNGYLTQ